ncbi:MAG TPA: hypothetical protein VF246_02615 [Acidimicrobiia bacterium]
MELEASILERVRIWEQLSRWDRSELGRDLRRAGLSYGEIMELVPVKKSTLATWCRDVRLTEEQITAIKERSPSQAGVPKDTGRKRREEIAALRRRARTRGEELIQDPLWVAGVVLYWAEGAKGRNRVSMANADPGVLRLFVRWTRQHLTPDAEFTLHLHLHEGNDEAAARAHWKTVLGLHDAHFIKTYIKPRGTGHRKNHLPHGVCTVRLKRASDAWHTIMEWIDLVDARFAQPGGGSKLPAGR